MSPIDITGFEHPTHHERSVERRTVAVTQLVATAGLALCTLVAATAVSIGIARADTISAIVDNDMGTFALALLLGTVFAGMGGLTALMFPGPRERR